MIKYLYDVFLTSTRNDCSDLVIQALPMLLHDARTGVRQYTDEATDLAALHADYEALAAADGGLRRFIGRHYKALVNAYKAHERTAFDAVVAQCVAKDEEKKEAAEQEDEEE